MNLYNDNIDVHSQINQCIKDLKKLFFSKEGNLRITVEFLGLAESH